MRTLIFALRNASGVWGNSLTAGNLGVSPASDVALEPDEVPGIAGGQGHRVHEFVGQVSQGGQADQTDVVQYVRLSNVQRMLHEEEFYKCEEKEETRWPSIGCVALGDNRQFKHQTLTAT